ncbi:hypothetical protein Asd1617_02173 [Shigella dysenteriae 1617]|uniref:Uncharacterized protein n=1 Tax=Shigella dysenteriae 1617 TaxID=754093 RepID=A0A0A6ZT18_SHIDY|nr:hypothetical protein Asd1617_02173 [Shigella dysenteriae 1617]
MSWRYREPGAIEGHFSDQLFNARLTGLISVSELKNAVAVTVAKSVMAFRVLTMALTTRTMNVNAGHERTSKARIIHQIQLIRGITLYLTWGNDSNLLYSVLLF